MNLYSVLAEWRTNGAKKDSRTYGCVIAETEQKAIEKFKANIYYPKDLYVHFSAYEQTEGVYITKWTEEEE